MTTVDERDWLTARFEEHRTHLRSVAYRMLGSVSEAMTHGKRPGCGSIDDRFAVPFEEIGPLVERTPAAARQLASRARRRVHPVPPVGFEPTPVTLLRGLPLPVGLRGRVPAEPAGRG